jgi:flagellar biosynthetic protein FliR
MTLSWTLLQPYLLAFGLVLVRLSTAFFFVPVLGGTAIPLPSRISVAVVFSVLLTPLAMAQGPQTPEIVAVVLAAFGEFLVGLGIGLVVRLVLLIGEIAGAIVDLQMGFAFSMIADPLTRETTPVTARLMGVVTTLLFLLLDGHHYVIAGLGASLQHAPIGSGLARLSNLLALPLLLSTIMHTGLRIAAPVMVALLLSNASLALLARAAPQLNLFILGFGLSIGVGMIILATAFWSSLVIVIQHLRQLPGHLLALVGA